MGSSVFYFGFCMFHSYFELYEGLFYCILLHDLHSPCSVFLQVEISFLLMVEAWLRFLKEMFQYYFADISQVVTCLPSLPVVEGSDLTFLCLTPCAALNMWSRTAYFVLQNQLFRPPVSVVLLSVFHYSALFGLFLLDCSVRAVLLVFLSLCSVYVEAAIFTQNKTNKTHINLNFFL